MSERQLHTKERIGLTLATLVALGASACGSGNEQIAKATDTPTEPTITQTIEPTPVACEDQGKEMLFETDAFCEPASSEQLQWTLTAEKNGWILEDPLATYETQKALNIDTNNPIKISTQRGSLEYYQKTFKVLDFETGGKRITNIDNVNTSFNLVAKNANRLLNIANQYETATASAERTDVYNTIFASEGPLDYFVTLWGAPSSYNPDNDGKVLLLERLKEVVATATPNQIIEIMPAVRDSTDTTSFSDLNDLGEVSRSLQQIELTGSVKLKITTRTTSPEGIIASEEVTDLLQPGETFVIHRTNSAGTEELYTSDRWVIHTTAPTQ